MSHASIATLASLVCVSACLAQGNPQWGTEFGSALTGSDITTMAVIDEGSGPLLYMSGWADTIGGVAVQGTGRWNGGYISPVNSQYAGRNGIVRYDDDGEGPRPACIYFARDTSSNDQFRRWGITRWDGTNFTETTLPADTVRFSVDAITLHDPDGPQGPINPRLIALGIIERSASSHLLGVLQWDGNAWTQLGTFNYPNGNLRLFCATSYDPDGDGPIAPQLIVGGRYERDELQGGVWVRVKQPLVSRWNGSDWIEFGMPLNGGSTSGGEFFDGVNCMTVYDEDGAGAFPPALLVGGGFRNVASTYVGGFARWNGTQWSALGSLPARTTQTRVQCISVWDEDGTGPTQPTIFIGGRGLAAQDVFRWDGTQWSPLAATGPQNVLCMQPYDPDGDGPIVPSLVMSGSNALPNTRLVRWSQGQWKSLGNELAGDVYAIQDFDPDADGPEPSYVYAAGSFQSVNGFDVFSVARWANGEWHKVGESVNTNAGQLPNIHELAVFDEDGDGPQLPKLFALSEWNNQQLHLYRLDGTNWNRVVDSVTGWFPLAEAARTMCVFDDDAEGPGRPKLYIGGRISGVQDGQSLSYLITWDGEHFAQAPGLISLVPSHIDISQIGVHHLSTFDPDGEGPQRSSLIVVGAFRLLTPTPEGSPRIPAMCVARWDGQTWSSFADGLSPQIADPPFCGYAATTFDPDGNGPETPWLVVAHAMTIADGMPGNHISAWTGTQWRALGNGFNLPPFAVVSFDVDDDGPELPMLIAAGQFTRSRDNAVVLPNIAAWTGEVWVSLSGGVAQTCCMNPLVYTLRVVNESGFQSPNLLAGGYFTSAGGIPSKSFARWGPNTGMQALTVDGDNTVPPGDDAVLNAVVQGLGPFTFKWMHNGVPLSESTTILGTTTSQLRVRNASQGDAGQYSVQVWNPRGTNVAPASTLTVVCSADLDDDGNTSNGGSPDASVTIDDLLFFITAFEQGSPLADLDNDADPTTGNPDQAVTIDDLLFFLAHFEAGC